MWLCLKKNKKKVILAVTSFFLLASHDFTKAKNLHGFIFCQRTNMTWTIVAIFNCCYFLSFFVIINYHIVSTPHEFVKRNYKINDFHWLFMSVIGKRQDKIKPEFDRWWLLFPTCIKWLYKKGIKLHGCMSSWVLPCYFLFVIFLYFLYLNIWKKLIRRMIFIDCWFWL